MKNSLALLGRLTGISPVKDICPVPKSDRDFSIKGVVIEQTELYNKKMNRELMFLTCIQAFALCTLRILII